jgi:HSP20 family molecular chaperone IbpA
MQAQQALEKKAAASPLFVEAEKLFDQMKGFSQNVAQRAYELFESRGREIGHELEDWFRAEFEVMRWVPVEMKEADGKFIVRAEVPGFKAADIKVNVEPRQLTISGKHETKQEEKAENSFYSELRANQFYRCLTLPATVDTTKTDATLKDGVLELTLDKAPASQPVNVAVKTT